jgi:hypothetical protein
VAPDPHTGHERALGVWSCSGTIPLSSLGVPGFAGFSRSIVMLLMLTPPHLRVMTGVSADE